jgi:hypothetical protein
MLSEMSAPEDSVNDADHQPVSNSLGSLGALGRNGLLAPSQHSSTVVGIAQLRVLAILFLEKISQLTDRLIPWSIS